jgi:hypothetical protein
MSNELITPCIGFLQDYFKQKIRFRARVSECFADTLDGHAIHRLTLDDSSGRIQGLIWPDQAELASDVCAQALVEIEGLVTEREDDPAVHIRWLRQLAPNEIELGTELLPVHLCPRVALEAFSRLKCLERSLPDALRCFVRDLVCDQRIGIRLLTSPASGRHHHSYPGGLLVHSTEMLDAIQEIMGPSAKKDPLAVHVTQVGYLLHDLGKVLGVGRLDGSEPRRWYRHEHQALTLIDPHLDSLYCRSPQAADGIAYILSFLARHPKHRGYGTFMGADVVAMLDQISTAQAMGRTLSTVTTRTHLHPTAANDDDFRVESADGF